MTQTDMKQSWKTHSDAVAGYKTATGGGTQWSADCWLFLSCVQLSEHFKSSFTNKNQSPVSKHIGRFGWGYKTASLRQNKRNTTSFTSFIAFPSNQLVLVLVFITHFIAQAREEETGLWANMHRTGCVGLYRSQPLHHAGMHVQTILSAIGTLAVVQHRRWNHSDIFLFKKWRYRYPPSFLRKDY